MVMIYTQLQYSPFPCCIPPHSLVPLRWLFQRMHGRSSHSHIYRILEGLEQQRWHRPRRCEAPPDVSTTTAKWHDEGEESVRACHSHSTWRDACSIDRWWTLSSHSASTTLPAHCARCSLSGTRCIALSDKHHNPLEQTEKHTPHWSRIPFWNNWIVAVEAWWWGDWYLRWKHKQIEEEHFMIWTYSKAFLTVSSIVGDSYGEAQEMENEDSSGINRITARSTSRDSGFRTVSYGGIYFLTVLQLSYTWMSPCLPYSSMHRAILSGINAEGILLQRQIYKFSTAVRTRTYKFMLRGRL